MTADFHGMPLMQASRIESLLHSLHSSWTALLPSDWVLRLAVYTAIVLVLTTLLLMMQVLLLSAIAARRTARRRLFERKWRPVLARHSVIESSLEAGIVPPSGQERFWFLTLWNRTQRQLRGEARERLNFLLAELGLENFAVRQLRRRGVSRRLLTLESLSYVGDPQHWSQVEPWLRSTNTFISIAAAHSLISMDAARAMAMVLPMAMYRRDWSLQQLAALCRHAGRDAVTPPLLAELQTVPRDYQPRLVTLLSFAEPTQVAPWARTALDQHTDARTRQAALHTLADLADPRDRHRLLQALKDDDPGVRLAALQAFRRQAHPQDRELLLPLLSDRSWWMRQEAADALVALPGFSLSDGPTLLAQVTDRYGRQALERALSEAAL